MSSLPLKMVHSNVNKFSFEVDLMVINKKGLLRKNYG